MEISWLMKSAVWKSVVIDSYLRISGRMLTLFPERAKPLISALSAINRVVQSFAIDSARPVLSRRQRPKRVFRLLSKQNSNWMFPSLALLLIFVSEVKSWVRAFPSSFTRLTLPLCTSIRIFSESLTSKSFFMSSSAASTTFGAREESFSLEVATNSLKWIGVSFLSWEQSWANTLRETSSRKQRLRTRVE